MTASRPGDAGPPRPHPTALLLHPVTLVALAVMILNDGWWRAAWPSTVTGKLSDVAALVAFPGVLLAVWGAATLGLRAGLRALGVRWPPDPGPGALLLAVLVPALILTAINLSVTLRDAYLGLLGAVDVFGLGPFHYTLDPTDLWVLPACALPWWVGRRQAAGCRRPSRALS